MTLEEFNAKYIYQYDIDKFGYSEVWEVITPAADGIYYGDCDSYVLTVKYKVEGFADWNVYRCKSNGNGHAILINPEETMVLDNGKQIKDYDKFMEVKVITDLKKVNKFFMWFYMTYGRFKIWCQCKPVQGIDKWLKSLNK